MTFLFWLILGNWLVNSTVILMSYCFCYQLIYKNELNEEERKDKNIKNKDKNILTNEKVEKQIDDIEKGKQV